MILRYFKLYCVILTVLYILYRPFPSSKKSHLQNEAKCETFVVKMSFICIVIENHFHINGFALSLVLKVRFFWNSEMAYCTVVHYTVLYYLVWFIAFLLLCFLSSLHA